MRVFLIAFISSLFFVSGVFASAYHDNERGNKHYKSGKYNEALSAYGDALSKKPERAEIINNQANSLHHLNDNEAAILKYQEALKHTKNSKLKSRIFYNMGNAYAKSDRMKEAVNSYMNALKFNPNDQDAKYNLELARILMQTNHQQQQQQNGKGDDKDKDKKKGQKDDEQKDSNDSDQQKNEGKDGDQDDKQEQQKKPKPGEMSKEEAENVLNAVLDDEKNTQRKAKMEEAKKSGRKSVEKDW